MNKLTFLILPLFSLLLSFQVFAKSEEDKDKFVLPEYEFKTHDNVQAQVDMARTNAVNNDKLLLLVLGAQWCHDSRGLAHKFSSDEMQTILKQRFETVFVDVGYYKDLRELTAQFGYPGYFATPSVMVIDPESKQVLNMQSMAMWNSADSVPSNEVLAYFSSVGSEPRDANAGNDEVLKQVEDFAFSQTARLFAGFEQLGPLIEAIVDKSLEDDTQALALFDEIYDFRTTLQKDIHRLHKMAEDGTSNTTDLDIDFPSYGPFSWEK